MASSKGPCVSHYRQKPSKSVQEQAERITHLPHRQKL